MICEPKRILIVDDEESLTWSIAKNLQKQYKDYEVYPMNSGEGAIKILKRLSFNLVISDIQMPGIDGLVILDYVKKHSPNVPVIIMTSLDKSEIKDLAKKNSATYYFEKPFEMGEFKKTINEALGIAKIQIKEEIQNLTLKEFINRKYKKKFSGLVNVKNSYNSGVLHFHSGEIIHAMAGDLVGELALLNVLSWEKVIIEIKPTKKPIKKTIHYGWKLLVKDELLTAQ